MRQKFLPLLAILFLLACGKENSNDLLTEIETEQDSYGNGAATTRSANKRDVCHNGNIINVSINAIPAHQAHGDAVDMDQDGYFDIENPCSATDCDDTNAGTNPEAVEIPCNLIDDDCDSSTPDSAEEICDNGIDDDCDGDIDEDDGDCSTGCVAEEIPVVVDPNGISGDGDDYTIYVYPTDFGTIIPWSNNYTNTGATDNWDGLANNNIIVADQGAGVNYAAGYCASLEGCDWYLPSKGELDAIYQQLGTNGKYDFVGGWYWSSTEFNNTKAWAQLFINGAQSENPKNGDFPGRCRCVRK